MSFERLSLFAQGNDDDGGYGILNVALILVALLIVFIWKSFKSKRTPAADTKTASLNRQAPSRSAPKRHTITAEEVVNIRFQPTKFSAGYDQDQVDDLLSRTIRELQRLQDENELLQLRTVNPLSGPVPIIDPTLTPEQVVNQRFQPTKFRAGYSQNQVDDFLDKVVMGLREWTSENERLRVKLAGNVSS